MEENHQQLNNHIPVLLREVLQYLAPEKGNTLLDATAGYGGHAAAILNMTKQVKGSVLVDRDINAVTQLKQKFEDQTKKGLDILHGDFAGQAQYLAEQGMQFDLILADLGLSSPHLDNASRGFSFMHDGPLDMRMDSSTGQTAEELINNLPVNTLRDIFTKYGEDPKAKRVAQAIVEARPILTTHQLADVVASVYGGRGRYKAHPATKTFQALRIVVNDELAQLQMALPLWLKMLNPVGKMAIISFHSLEDRIVKTFLAEHGGDRYDAEVKILTKKPVTASNTELVSNPRARSAKLRVAVKK